MKELINFRNRREKHFLNPDGTITAKIYDEDIHCLKNGKWVDIDNTLVDKGKYFINKINSFNAIFNKNSNDLFEVKKDQYYLKFICKNHTNLKLEKIHEKIKYLNTAGKIDFIYELKNNKLKESIVLNCIDTIPDTLDFEIDTNLKLSLQENGSIHALDNNSDIVFLIDKPYMLDSNMSRNDNIKYDLITTDRYTLKLKLDLEWLKNAKFPVIIDPTIFNGFYYNVQDTYISSSEPNRIYNGVEHLRLGSNNEGIFRVLLKFDLPTIGTGCTVVEAKAFLKTYDKFLFTSFDASKPINAHSINTQWDETTATWNNMNDKYDARVETWTQAEGHDLYNINEDVFTEVDVTSIVKKWYAGQPNYGIMLKLDNEVAENPELLPYMAYSKSYDLNHETGNQPFLTIKYLYQNGIIPYMTYNCTEFTTGMSYVNLYNGNLTGTFNLTKFVNKKYPLLITLVYNNNDLILNNQYGFGKGWKLNVDELIQEEKIEDIHVLRYIDSSNAIHYFYENGTGKYVDEEGLKLEIEKIDNNYILKDSLDNKRLFAKISDSYRLTQIKKNTGEKVDIEYAANILSKISLNEETIKITYTSSGVTISSNNDVVNIVIENNLLKSIENKFGKICLDYNKNNIISKIVDTDLTYVSYDYYDTLPFRIKNIGIYGYEGSNINSYNFDYGYNTTTIKNGISKNVYSFNDFGNTIGTVIYESNDSGENINNAYGVSQNFIDSTQNPFLINRVDNRTKVIKYINNLISDSSFENGDTNVGNGIRVKSNSNIGYYCCKFSNEYTYEYSINKGNDYTFSCYLKSKDNGTINLYKRINNSEIKLASKAIKGNVNEYIRYYITGYFENSSSLIVKINIDNGKEGYIDNLQLEEGKVVNMYNLVDNSNFSNDFLGWNARECDIIKNKYINVARLNSNHESGASLSKIMNISGKKGDCYNLSFWYKNEGVINTQFEFVGNMANLAFMTGEEFGGCTYNLHLNNHATEWQFFCATFEAENDYENVVLNIVSSQEANFLYITNVMLVKDLLGTKYIYNDQGLISSVLDENRSICKQKYGNDHQLLALDTQDNQNFKYEYDSKIKNKILRVFSSKNISKEFIYDEKENITDELILNTELFCDDLLDKSFSIRPSGSTKYLHYNVIKNTFSFETDICNHQLFKLSKVDDLYYRLQFQNKFIAFDSNGLYALDYENDDSLFSIIFNENGSITLVPKNENGKTIGCKDYIPIIVDADEKEIINQFYFETHVSNKKLVYKNYYDNKNNIICKSSPIGRYERFTYDALSGKKISAQFANKAIVNYEYNKKEQIISKNFGIDKILYKYNEQNLLSEIVKNSDIVKLYYDEFSNLKKVYYNNQLICEKVYDSCGKILSEIYANGNQIKYDYDFMYRVIGLEISGKKYDIFYDNMNNIAKIESSDEVYSFLYDFSNRLIQIDYNDNYICKYIYDDCNNIRKKIIILDDYYFETEFEYNKANQEIRTKLNINNVEFNSYYDELQRLIKTDINGKILMQYFYKSNGEYTSYDIVKIIIDNDTYQISYDDRYNISSIKRNGKIIYKYKYNKLNELIEEKDILNEKIYKYVYDQLGNLIYKKECKLDDTIISVVTMEYDNVKIVKYNNDLIEYDSFGNIIKIGNKQFDWVNGNCLKTYLDEKIKVDFEYDYRGFPIKKQILNDISTFYYQGENLILEKRNNDMLYYLYDSSDLLIGLKYNDEVYYYQKNQYNDILGIYNSKYELIAKYYYDAWGNTIGIVDCNGNEITDIANIAYLNPFRYRSYYYDNDLGLYFLKNRYYSPIICRFMNLDSRISGSLLGTNLYLYCNNNPVNYCDTNGCVGVLTTFLTVLGKAIFGCSMGYVANGTFNTLSGEDFNDGATEACIGGAVTEILGMKYSPAASAAIYSGAKNTTVEAYKYASGQKEFTPRNALNSMVNIGGNVIVDTSIAEISNGISSKCKSDLKLYRVGRPAEKPSTILFGKAARKEYLASSIDIFTEENVSRIMDPSSHDYYYDNGIVCWKEYEK